MKKPVSENVPASPEDARSWFVGHFSACAELDTIAAAETEAALKPLFDSTGKDLVLDCTDLQYIASSGIRIPFMQGTETMAILKRSYRNNRLHRGWLMLNVTPTFFKGRW